MLHAEILHWKAPRKASRVTPSFLVNRSREHSQDPVVTSLISGHRRLAAGGLDFTNRQCHSFPILVFATLVQLWLIHVVVERGKANRPFLCAGGSSEYQGKARGLGRASIRNPIPPVLTVALSRPRAFAGGLVRTFFAVYPNRRRINSLQKCQKKAKGSDRGTQMSVVC